VAIAPAALGDGRGYRVVLFAAFWIGGVEVTDAVLLLSFFPNKKVTTICADSCRYSKCCPRPM
jgi:hypothetical protein